MVLYFVVMGVFFIIENILLVPDDARTSRYAVCVNQGDRHSSLKGDRHQPAGDGVDVKYVLRHGVAEHHDIYDQFCMAVGGVLVEILLPARVGQSFAFGPKIVALKANFSASLDVVH